MSLHWTRVVEEIWERRERGITEEDISKVVYLVKNLDEVSIMGAYGVSLDTAFFIISDSATPLSAFLELSTSKNPSIRYRALVRIGGLGLSSRLNREELLLLASDDVFWHLVTLLRDSTHTIWYIENEPVDVRLGAVHAFNVLIRSSNEDIRAMAIKALPILKECRQELTGKKNESYLNQIDQAIWEMERKKSTTTKQTKLM